VRDGGRPQGPSAPLSKDAAAAPSTLVRHQQFCLFLKNAEGVPEYSPGLPRQSGATLGTSSPNPQHPESGARRRDPSAARATALAHEISRSVWSA